MQPIAVEDFEPPEAQALHWLPLAVRFKLDTVGLKVGLAEWQALPLADRRLLLACAAGPAFRALLAALVPQARRLQPLACPYPAYLQRKRLRSPAAAAP